MKRVCLDFGIDFHSVELAVFLVVVVLGVVDGAEDVEDFESFAVLSSTATSLQRFDASFEAFVRGEDDPVSTLRDSAEKDVYASGGDAATAA